MPALLICTHNVQNGHTPGRAEELHRSQCYSGDLSKAAAARGNCHQGPGPAITEPGPSRDKDEKP